MTIDQFSAISQKEQVDIVAEKGVLLAYRKEGLTMYDLYNIDSFFIEFCYHLAQNNTVKMKVFQDPLELKPYFSNNDFTEIFEPPYSSDDPEENIDPDYLQSQGVLMGEKFDGEFRISLYKVNSFYVEQFFHMKNQEKVGIRTFQNTDDVNSYINTNYLKLN
jgi:hypothetical protein